MTDAHIEKSETVDVQNADNEDLETVTPTDPGEGDHGLPDSATKGFDPDAEPDADADPTQDADPGDPHDGDPVTPDDLDDDDDDEDH